MFKSVLFFLVAFSSFLHGEMIGPFHMESSTIRSYQIIPDNQKAKSFFELSEEEQRLTLVNLNELYRTIEETAPAAGYRIRFVGSNAGQNPMEVQLYAYGSREKNTSLEMAAKPACPFCSKIKQNEQLKGFEEETESEARIIETLQGNALIVSSSHKEHWFQNTLSEQQAILAASRKFLESVRKGDRMNYEFHIHCGKLGHQKIPHTHVHLLVGTNLVLERSPHP